MVRAGGDQRIPRPAAVWVRPTNPFARLDHSSLRSTPELLARLQRFTNTLEQSPPPEGSRASAVLVPIFDGPSGPEVVLTRRSQALTNHRGEVSFLAVELMKERRSFRPPFEKRMKKSI